MGWVDSSGHLSGRRAGSMLPAMRWNDSNRSGCYRSNGACRPIKSILGEHRQKGLSAEAQVPRYRQEASGRLFGKSFNQGIGIINAQLTGLAQILPCLQRFFALCIDHSPVIVGFG